jgi:hypothetical protein
VLKGATASPETVKMLKGHVKERLLLTNTRVILVFRQVTQDANKSKSTFPVERYELI